MVLASEKLGDQRITDQGGVMFPRCGGVVARVVATRGLIGRSTAMTVLQRHSSRIAGFHKVRVSLCVRVTFVCVLFENCCFVQLSRDGITCCEIVGRAQQAR